MGGWADFSVVPVDFIVDSGATRRPSVAPSYIYNETCL